MEAWLFITGFIMLVIVGDCRCGNSTAGSLSNASVCPDGINEAIDFGNLTAPGPGRVLEIRGKDFYVYGDKVFLSGVTARYILRDRDFGSNHYENVRDVYECYLRKIHQAGGNTMRTIVHGRGFNTPEFDSTGHVISMDKYDTLVTDLRKYLRAAAHYDIVVFLTLWETTVYHKLDGLMKDESVLQSYIDNALIPLVKALKDEPGLGGFEIIERVEGNLIIGEANTEPCFDTVNAEQGWAGKMYTMQEMLRFINRQADAIRRIDPGLPVTASSLRINYNTDQLGFFNYHKDECLLKAGGRPQGVLSFYVSEAIQRRQFAMKFNSSDYHLDKPMIINDSDDNLTGMSVQDVFQWAYYHGYSGALICCANFDHKSHQTKPLTHQMSGIESIKSEANNYRTHVSFSLSKYQIVNPH